MSNTHNLKVQLAFFDELVSGKKTFELRKNDRNFSVGDILVLEEYNMSLQSYTGRSCKKSVTYILENIPEFGILDGFCIMGLKNLDENVSDFMVIDKIANECGNDGVAMFPDMISTNQTKKGVEITFGMPHKSIDWIIKDSHYFCLYAVKKEDFIRIKSQLEGK